MLSIPAPRSMPTASPMRAASWERCIHRSTRSSNDCAPSETRLTPARRQAVACSRRSEEHTSELQSRQYLVCRLLLEKKKNRKAEDRLKALQPKPAAKPKPPHKLP